MAAINEVNFNGREAKDYIKDCLCSNPLSIGDCSVESAANVLRSNIGTWEWLPIQNESIYTTDKCYGEGETTDEAIERIVKEVVSKLTKEGDIMVTPKIEKYHLKHK